MPVGAVRGYTNMAVDILFHQGTAVVASVGFMLMARYFVIRRAWGKA